MTDHCNKQTVFKYCNKAVFVGYLVVAIGFSMNVPDSNPGLFDNNWEIAEIVLLFLLLGINIAVTVKERSKVYFK